MEIYITLLVQVYKKLQNKPKLINKTKKTNTTSNNIYHNINGLLSSLNFLEVRQPQQTLWSQSIRWIRSDSHKSRFKTRYMHTDPSINPVFCTLATKTVCFVMSFVWWDTASVHDSVVYCERYPYGHLCQESCTWSTWNTCCNAARTQDLRISPGEPCTMGTWPFSCLCFF